MKLLTKITAFLLAAVLLCFSGCQKPDGKLSQAPTAAPSEQANAPTDAPTTPEHTPAEPCISFKNALPTALAAVFINTPDEVEWGEHIAEEVASGAELTIRFSDFSGVSGSVYDIGTIDMEAMNYDAFDIILTDGDVVTLALKGDGAEFTVLHADGTTDAYEAVMYMDEPSEGRPSGIISVALSRAFEYSTDSESLDVYATYEYDGALLIDEAAEKYPELAAALLSANTRRAEQSLQAYLNFAEAAHEAYQAHGGDDAFTAQGFSDRVFVRRAESNALSLLFLRAGSITGEYSFYSETYDPRTGERLMLSDVVNDVDALAAAIVSALEASGSDFLLDEETDLTKEFTAPSDKLAWTLDPTGLNIVLNGGEFDEAHGGLTPAVFIPYGEVSELVKKEYLPKSEAHTVAFPIDSPLQAVIGDEVCELSIGGIDDTIIIRFNGASLEERLEDVFDVEPLYVHANGADYLYLKLLSHNDYRFLTVYSLTDGGIERIGEFHGSWNLVSYPNSIEDYSSYEMIMTDPARFELYTVTDIMGTADGFKTYSIGSDGMPKTEDECFNIIWDVTFTLKQRLELHYVTEAGDMDVRTAEFDAGAEFTYYRTDDEKFVDLKAADGKLVRLMIENGAVDGVMLEELFDGIIYSG